MLVRGNGIVPRSAQVVLSQQVSMVNPRTAKEHFNIVTFIGLKGAGLGDVSIAFSEPSVPFGGIRFSG